MLSSTIDLDPISVEPDIKVASLATTLAGKPFTLTTTGSTVATSISGVRIDSEFEGQTAQSTPLINLDDFRNDPRLVGVDGSGYAVAILDTGIDLDHPFFGPDGDGNGVADRIVYTQDFTTEGDGTADDENDHGSNVSSIIGSSDATHTGMAPGVNLIHLQVLEGDGGGQFSWSEQALQWVVNNAATFNIVAVNMSLGDSGNYTSEQSRFGLGDELAALNSLGVIVASAAGNSFFSHSSAQGVGYPAADPNSLAVGAVFDSNIGSVSYSSGASASTTAADRLTPFTQRHATMTQIFAPGAASTGAGSDGSVVSFHGTSQATPHIAGIAALAQQVADENIGRRLTPDEFETLMRDSAVFVNDGDDEDDNVTNTGLNFPRVDVLALAEAIIAIDPPEPTTGDIDGLKWNDLNGDGVKQGGEPGLPGWTIYIDQNDNNVFDQNISQTIDSVDVPKNILDNTTISSDVVVSGLLGSISDVNVKLDITHTFDGDLQAFLVSPTGTRVELFGGVGGSGNDFDNTIFNDEAATSITAGSAPFSGSFQPEGTLANLDGQDPNGTWRLEITDAFNLDTGTLNGWSLTLAVSEPFTTTAADGTYQFTDRLPATYTIREVGQAGWTQTFPGGAGEHAAVVVVGETTTDINFGNAIRASIGDTVFNDVDGNGVQDPGEPGIGNVTVDLHLDNNGDGQLDEGDTFHATQTTDGNGLYRFVNLDAGDYIVEVTDTNNVLAGFVLTSGGAAQTGPAFTMDADLDAIIREISTNRKQYFIDSIDNGLAAGDPTSIYNVQLYTNNVLRYAAQLQDVSLLDEMSQIYLAAYDDLQLATDYLYYYWPGDDYISSHPLPQPANMWLDAGGFEIILESSQFLYAVSYLINNILDVAPGDRTQAMNDIVTNFASVVLNDHYERWVFTTQGSFQVTGWGSDEGLMNHYEYVQRRINNELGDDDPDAVSYVNAVTDIDTWIMSGVAEMIAAHRKDPTLVPLGDQLELDLLDYLSISADLVQSRIEATALTDLGGNPATGLVFEPDVWRDHPEYGYSGYTGEPFPTPADAAVADGVSWDISHARRFVQVFDTFGRNGDLLDSAFFGDVFMQQLTNQFIYGAFNGDVDRPLTRNFIDGTNGWYRVDQDTPFGYAPYGLTRALMNGGYGFWSDYNDDVDVVMQSLWDLIQGPIVNDESGNGRHATLSGGQWIDTSPVGGAVQFANDGYVDGGVYNQFVSPAGSIEFWFQYDDANVEDDLVDIWENSYQDFLLIRRVDADKILLYIEDDDAGVVAMTSTAPVTPDTWHHVVVTQDGAGAKIYIDGQDANATGIDSGYWTNHLALAGSWFSKGQWYGHSGALDEVRIYDRALSLAEVTEHYNGTFNNAVGLLAHWSFSQQPDAGAGTFVTQYYGTSFSPSDSLDLLQFLPTFIEPVANAAQNVVMAVSLGANEQFNDADFGYQDQSAAIGDTVFDDVDGDGAQELLEPGLLGVTVNLYRDDGDSVFEGGGQDAQVTSQVTGGAGLYDFTGLAAGDYWVDVDQTSAPLGGAPLTTGNDPLLVNLGAGEDHNDADFGFQLPSSNIGVIGDLVFNDLDGSGAHDPGAGEPGIDGVPVRLYLDDDDSIFEPGADDLLANSTTSAGGGAYGFDKLPDGSYWVDVDQTAAPVSSLTLTTSNDPTLVTLTGATGGSTGAGNLSDPFDGPTLDPAWQPSVGQLPQDTWVASFAANDLHVTDIVTTNPRQDWLFVRYDQPVNLTGNWEVAFDLAWDNAEGGPSAEANMSQFHVNLYDGNGDRFAASGFHDAWVDSVGGQDHVLGPSVLFTGADSIDPAGATAVRIVGDADAGQAHILWDQQTILTVNEIVDIARIELEFAIYSFPTSHFGEITLDNLVVTSDTPPAEPQHDDLDFGFLQLDSQISGVKFEDVDGDGEQDAGELGLPGWTIQLQDTGGAVLDTTVTAADGSYAFGNLGAGDYRLREVQQPGWVQTTANPADINLAAGGQVTGVLFGNFETVDITGVKFEDDNGDGVKGAGETGLQGWTIRLLDSGDNELATTTTAADGSYAFADLGPVSGGYRVREALQAGWTQTTTDPVDIVVTSGVDAPGIDFGNFDNISISGLKFEDEDESGTLNGVEAGLAGWTIQLIDPSDSSVIAATVTADDGTYSFDDLGPASSGYRVREVQQVGWVQSTSDPTDIAAVSGGDAVDLRFGNYKTNTIAGVKFEDENGNGAQDQGETGLLGRTIRLLDTGDNELATTTTAADGSYAFVGLAPGTYRVREAAQQGWTQTSADPADFSLTSGDIVSSVAFGNFDLVSISGLKFEDVNGDGTRDDPGTEVGLPGWTIRLLDSGDNELATTVTAGDGSYTFAQLGPGSYRVREAAQTGWTQTTTDPADIIVTSGDDVTNVLFGNVENITISGAKFEDENGNGVKDEGEIGLPDWTIQLIDADTGGVLDTRVTGGDGTYSFSGLSVATYRIREISQPGWTQTTADPADIVAVSGQNVFDVDFGNFDNIDITGLKFEDENGNGVKDEGEVGLSGWTIRLLDGADSELATTTTAVDGSYAFGDLGPGTYRPREVLQSGWTQTTANPADIIATSGDDASGTDFGNFENIDITGTKFEDENGNGVKDQGEIGLADWTILLIDPASGSLLDSTITGPDGSYAFGDLGPAAGGYRVRELVQAGWTQTTSDPADISATSGDDAPGADFGNFRNVTISGVKFEDENGNGVKDEGETGLPGWTIRLLDSGDIELATTVTAADGSYAFSDLVPGTYRAREVAQAGWTQTTGDPIDITVTSADDVAGVDFGNFDNIAVSGIKFEDENGNGVQDEGEVCLPGWTIRLLDDGDTALATTVTAVDGSYSFADLSPGTYRAREVLQGGWTQTTADPADIVATSADDISGVDFGNFDNITISGIKFEDENGDGVKDPGDVGLPGWTIRLLDGVDDELATTVTAADGSYAFSDLGPGTYHMREVLQSGWTQTTSNPDDIVATSADDAPGIDFGNFDNVTISGIKFEDENGDGVNDQGEVGLPGWTIRLLDSGDNELATTVTAVDGSYTFNDLGPGTYRAREVLQTGWTRTTTNPADIIVTSADNVSGVDFGNFENITLAGIKFEDENGNGVKDLGEVGLPGWTIRLLDGDDNELATTVTAADGSYAFDDLGPGAYRTREILQSGWTQTTANPADITATSGDDALGVDFGNFENITISGVKFEDRTGNGVRDEGDDGLADWIIQLIDAADSSVLQSTSTDAGGAYSFTDLGPDVQDYRVREVQQAEWTQTTDDPADVTAISGDDANNVSFGNIRNIAISGIKFEDENGNGVKDEGEVGLSGWTIQLLDATSAGVLDTRLTEADGSFSFSDLTPSPDGFRLREVNQAGWTQTTADPDDIFPVSGQDVFSVLFGNFEHIDITGVKFEDENGNGVKDQGEIGLPGWTIRLLNGDDSELATTVTAGDGSYAFADLGPGTYRAREVLQSGWTQTTTNPADIVATSADDAPGIDFGNFHNVTVSGVKFEDENGNGVKDQGEVGLPGWTIRLLDDGDNELATTITAGDGSYAFGDLGPAPGGYRAREVLQSGWTQTTTDPADIVVTSADAAPGIDFGNFENITVSGVKFEDTDADGVQDQGELGLPGWTIRLLDGNDNELATTITAGDGSYAFSDLGPGTYRAREVLQAGWVQITTDPADVVATSADDVPGVDFGNFELGEIRGTKFEDFNLNGVQDDDEPGVEGWTIRLAIDEDGNGQAEQTPETVTGVDGSYAFTDLRRGTYTVTEEMLPGVQQTAPGGPAGLFEFDLFSGQVDDQTHFGNARTREFNEQVKLTVQGEGNLPIGISLRGPGQGIVVLPLTGQGDARSILLTGTTADSKLSIDPAGDLTTLIHLIVGDPEDPQDRTSIGGIDASAANILGNVIITGFANALAFGNIKDDHLIEIGAPDDPDDTATFSAEHVTNTIINSEIAFSKFTVESWTDTGDAPDVINAPWIGKLDVNGNFEAGLNLSGAGAPNGVTLNKVTIDGDLGSGDALVPITWDITGDLNKFDASKGVTEGFDLILHSDVNKMKFGRIEAANITLDDGRINKLNFTQWNKGSLTADAVGKLTSKVGKNDPQATGDMRATVTLTGPTSGLTVSKVKIAGDLGSGDGDNPITWEFTGDIGKIDATKGTVEGFEMIVHSNVSSMKLGNVQQADITVGDPGDRGEINKFSFQQWERGTIIAGRVNKLTGKAKQIGTSGDFKGALQVTGDNVAAEDNALHKVSIAGRVLDALIEVLKDDVGSFTAGAMQNSRLRVGVNDVVGLDDLPDDVGDFNPGAGAIGKVSIKGLKGAPKTNPSFINSIIAAFTIGKASFKVIQTDNLGSPHGLAATAITKVTTTREDGVKLPKLSKLVTQQDVIDKLASFDVRDLNLSIV